MVRNRRFEARVSEEALRRFDIKVKQAGCKSRADLIEKIAFEPTIFLEDVRQKFKSKIEVSEIDGKEIAERSLYSQNKGGRVN
jgi:hypothetical protein